MKLHIGCGPIYLDGWTNVDVNRPGMYLAKDRPDLVEQLRTTEEKYYEKQGKRDIDTLRAVQSVDGVCDAYGTAQLLPFSQKCAGEVLLRQVFEHFSLGEARSALDEFERVLRPGGILRLDVPDHDGTVEELMKTHDPFYFRHMFGSRSSQYGYHLMSYTRDGLKKLVEEGLFLYLGDEPNIHFYPAFLLRFVRLQGSKKGGVV